MTPSNNRKHRAQQKTRPQGSNPGTPTERTVHDNFMVLESYAKNKTPTKGQLISKCTFGVFKSSKKNNKIFLQDFCPSL